ncbi:MAG: hypothetical protein U0802_18980 [Candidatus Binatia bacterium]
MPGPASPEPPDLAQQADQAAREPARLLRVGERREPIGNGTPRRAGARQGAHWRRHAEPRTAVTRHADGAAAARLGETVEQRQRAGPVEERMVQLEQQRRAPVVEPSTMCASHSGRRWSSGAEKISPHSASRAPTSLSSDSATTRRW